MYTHSMAAMALFALLVAGPRPAGASPVGGGATPVDTLAPYSAPTTLEAEHYEIFDELHVATLESGRVGEAARSLAELLGPHFVKEQEYALPPLALLPALARGESYEEMREILAVTDRLALELPAMLEEHKAIAVAAEELRAAGMAASRPELEHLAELVLRHAQNEEDVSYPAALLVGRIVEFRLGRTAWYPDSR